MSLMRRLATYTVVLVMLFVMAGCSEDDDNGTGSTDNRTLLTGEVSGQLTSSKSPYLMASDVTVPEGMSLTIEPGVEIFVNGFYAFNVEGEIIARGDEDNFITFTTDKYPKNKGDWRGLWLVGADDSSELEYVRISYANKYNIIEDTTRVYDENNIAFADTLLHRGALTIRECSPTVNRCIVDNAGYDAIHVVGNASPVISYNTIVHNSFNGVRIEPDLNNVYGDKVVIRNNIIVENDDSGIRAFDNNVNVEIAFNDIWNNASLTYLPVGLAQYATTDVHLNPEFNDIQEGDYSLHPCSGAIDRGDPDDSADPDGTIPDVGALPHYQDENELTHILRDERLHLTANHGHYNVTCDVTVAAGDTLIIDAGVEIRFIERFKFSVYGTLIAEGTESNPIIFTSGREEKSRSDWKQLFLVDGTDDVLKHVIIEYASVDDISDPFYLGALSLNGCSPTIENLTIRNTYNVGLFCFDGSSPKVTDLEVMNTGQMGVYCLLNSNPKIVRAKIHNIDGYGFKMSRNSKPEISNALVYDVGVSGIVMEELSSPTITNVTVYGPESHAVRMTKSCRPLIRNSIFVDYHIYGMDAQISSRPRVLYGNFYSSIDGASSFAGINDNDPNLQNILNVDPKFVSASENNFRLLSSSQCVDAGNEDPAFNDRDGSVNDLGAYGGPEAWE